jgi:two-component system, OmpR family, heavy metal sensor histidine kinase CusS
MKKIADLFSMTTKLALLYALSAGILLLLVSSVLYWILLRELDRETGQFLSAKAKVLQGTLSGVPLDKEDLGEELASQGDYMKSYVRIVNSSGNVIAETPDVDRLGVFQSGFASPQQKSKLLGPWKLANGRLYQFLQAPAKVGESGEVCVIQLALDVSSRERVIASYRKKLMLVLILGVAASSAIGVAVAKKGLKPLNDFADVARNITADRLEERIGTSQLPAELKVVASEFDAMLSRLQDSFNRLSQFSADLAHEVRTPVNNIRGETEVALSRVRTVDEYRHVLESNLEECERLSGMIDSLLFLARAENVQTVISPSKLDASKEVTAVREFYEAMAADQEIRIVCKGSSSLYADQVLLRRALSNLVSNSLQYTPRQGLITILIQQSNGEVDIAVSDTGAGIRSDLLSKVFDRFYRSEQARINHPRGSGLGLAIVKSIMDLHHGRASVQSEPGKGTTVTLSFPSTT